MFGESKQSLEKKRLFKYIAREDRGADNDYLKPLFESKLAHECEIRRVMSDNNI
ncbi:hypothetical protein [Fusibacter sp. 3D3]|uniref:hypothetical protein n=1 Tax=Fusibacter sp. 3D3 TaxID=1048380 RepID=UPI000857A02F|nr:hypothetical protein [Fusibacter sp. 3D3]GAU79822.1 hypothetical protein F3D3_4487 [Fusibacter sp. 3D3]